MRGMTFFCHCPRWSYGSLCQLFPSHESFRHAKADDLLSVLGFYLSSNAQNTLRLRSDLLKIITVFASLANNIMLTIASNLTKSVIAILEF